MLNYSSNPFSCPTDYEITRRFYVTRNYITVFTKALCLILPPSPSTLELDSNTNSLFITDLL
jgi:hypothetical protein